MLFEQYKVVDTLKTIRYLESNDCQNTKHKSDAMGCYGLRPIALKQIGFKPFRYSQITQKLIATKYANHILTYTDEPSTEFLLYGWLKGPSAAKKRQRLFNYGRVPYRNPFSDHWYIKRFYKQNKLILRFDFL